ncbi:hypothetical protein FQZ97_804630 [compost metagenome]
MEPQRCSDLPPPNALDIAVLSRVAYEIGGDSVVVAEPCDGESHTILESKKPACAGFFVVG